MEYTAQAGVLGDGEHSRTVVIVMPGFQRIRRDEVHFVLIMVKY